jgi:hypothetical protein
LFLQLFVASFLLIGQITTVRVVEGSVLGIPEHFIPGFFLLLVIQSVHYVTSSCLNA